MEIIEQIRAVFADNPGFPLFYVESGSRLWGFESPDSDYDIRGFHLQSRDQYLDYQSYPDVITVSKGLFDFVSFDLDKLFQLLSKSNPSCLEWLRAHMIYLNQFPDFENFTHDIMECIDFRALYHHYLSLANNHVVYQRACVEGLQEQAQGERPLTYKSVLYCLRGLLSAEVSSRGELPPLLVEDLVDTSQLDSDVLELMRQCIDIKKQVLEKTPVEQLNQILAIVNHTFDTVRQLQIKKSGNSERLKTLLSRRAIELKSRFYCNG